MFLIPIFLEISSFFTSSLSSYFCFVAVIIVVFDGSSCVTSNSQILKLNQKSNQQPSFYRNRQNRKYKHILTRNVSKIILKYFPNKQSNFINSLYRNMTRNTFFHKIKKKEASVGYFKKKS